jgi:hypothetical protein
LSKITLNSFVAVNPESSSLMFSSDMYSLSLGMKRLSFLENKINGINDYFKNKNGHPHTFIITFRNTINLKMPV